MEWLGSAKGGRRAEREVKAVLDTASVKTRVDLLITEIRDRLDNIEDAFGDPEDGTVESNESEGDAGSE